MLSRWFAGSIQSIPPEKLILKQVHVLSLCFCWYFPRSDLIQSTDCIWKEISHSSPKPFFTTLLVRFRQLNSFLCLRIALQCIFCLNINLECWQLVPWTSALDRSCFCGLFDIWSCQWTSLHQWKVCFNNPWPYYAHFMMFNHLNSQGKLEYYIVTSACFPGQCMSLLEMA